MNRNKFIQEELKELESDLPIVKTPAFAVPDGYFDTLFAHILAKIKEAQVTDPAEELQSLSPLLAAIPKKTPYTLPDNYFNTTITTLPSLIQEEEMPSVLAGATKAMPYHVPEGYFETLPHQILNKVAKPRAKVISFNRHQWMRYASAAVVTGMLVLGGILYFDTPQKSIDPVRQPHAWVAKKLQNVSNQELKEFINTADVSSHGQEMVQTRNNGTEVRKLLNDVPNNELHAFLSQVPTENEENLTVN